MKDSSKKRKKNMAENSQLSEKTDSRTKKTEKALERFSIKKKFGKKFNREKVFVFTYNLKFSFPRFVCK
ncbi:hypothetical protein BRARA_F02008 [Brassica rapa]|uniref:Uncharacterized protein n=1 Tax=Brassica campestris TaxID=3711 RepID=A0A397YZT0_BRACM|nr:hypothetical protein BRARA_F02008 [Brassica rapa]